MEKINIATAQFENRSGDKEYNLSKNAADHNNLENNPEYMSIKAQIMMLQTFAQELSDDPRLLLASDSKYAIKYFLHPI